MSKWKIASSYVIGQGHIRKNLPCQDRTFKLTKKDLSGEFYGVALADGAGSYAHSDIGAEMITKKILYFIKRKFKYIQKYNNPEVYILKYIKKELEKLSKEKNIDIKEFSSTLLFIAIQNNDIIIGHIGDGIIGVLDNNDNLKIVSYPENGEYSNSTFFTTSFKYKKRLRIIKAKIKNSKGFILMSDGSEESLYDKQNKILIDINKQIINWLEKYSENAVENALKQNLEQAISKKTHDDCSIAIMRKI